MAKAIEVRRSFLLSGLNKVGRTSLVFLGIVLAKRSTITVRFMAVVYRASRFHVHVLQIWLRDCMRHRGVGKKITDSLQKRLPVLRVWSELDFRRCALALIVA